MVQQLVKNVIYVDDDQDMLQLIKAVMELDNDVNLKTFTSPALALADIQREAPDLVILDYQIPQMNGTEIMHEIHQMRPDLNIVFFTAQSAPEEISKIKSLGAKKVIVKPIDIQQIKNQLII